MGLEHKAFLVLKVLNMEMKLVGERRMLQLNDFDELFLFAYEHQDLQGEN